MKTLFSKQLLVGCCYFLFLFTAQAQGKANDISVGQLPAEVKKVLVQYIDLLSTSKNLAECASKFATIAGGSLVNESTDKITLRSSVEPYALKKDYENCKFYAQPVEITRVNVSRTAGSGFGATTLAGTIYKVWIAKKEGEVGLPAPVSIIVPENHKTIKTPKIINIGSF